MLGHEPAVVSSEDEHGKTATVVRMLPKTKTSNAMRRDTLAEYGIAIGLGRMHLLTLRREIY